MKTALILKTAAEIEAPATKVWEALTNPEIIKQYFFGTEVVSEWEKGSSIIFKGTWEDKPYEDKGTILDIVPGKLLRYNYYNSWFSAPDVPENYANITYELTPDNGKTLLTITQDGFEDEEKKAHSEKNWNWILNELKKLIEKQTQS
jgi:uncharacterized protein YndB with AHSA1/START domain